MSEPDNISTGIVRQSSRSDPTIDEMLKYLDRNCVASDRSDRDNLVAIRSILEQHCNTRLQAKTLESRLGDVAREMKLEAVRAFVERVEKRLPEYNTGKGADSWLREYHKAVLDELEAMEKEAE